LEALEKELQNTRESHQITIEELESSNEELKSTNEELQSANEELQSTNEELESSKEELQSLNEELHTVNSELQSKVDELSEAHDDMRNLLNTIEIATVFVDNDMCIRRFTTRATSIINLIQTDIGRPIQHVVPNLVYENMVADLAEVLKTLTPKEAEVESRDHHWYKMRIIPYRTTDNRIDGAVLTFASIDAQRQAQQILQVSNEDISDAWYLACEVLDMTPDPLVVLDDHNRIVLANDSFTQWMRVAPEKARGMDVYAVGEGVFGKLGLKEKLQHAMEKEENFQLDIKDKGQLFVRESGACLLKGRIIHADENSPRRLLLQFVKEQ